jgi:hypothetical protein
MRDRLSAVNTAKTGRIRSSLRCPGGEVGPGGIVLKCEARYSQALEALYDRAFTTSNRNVEPCS